MVASLPLIQLVYISTARPERIHDGCSAILDVARRDNAAAGITGLLLFNGERFLQVLEGGDTAVEALFARIVRDPRHRGVVRLSHRRIRTREYGNWAMQFVEPGTRDEALLAQATQLNGVARDAIRAGVEGYAAFMPV